MKNFTIPFDFTVYDGEEILCSDTHSVTLSEKDVKAVADAMKSQNGGLPVPLLDASTVCDKMTDSVFVDFLSERFPDFDDYDNVSVELQENMPQELIDAADSYIDLIDADVKYHASADGFEYDGTSVLGVPTAAFNKMVAAAKEDHHGLCDFDFLKEFAPEAYDLIYDWASEDAYKFCLSAYNVAVEVTLKDFPYQVYECI